MKWGTAVKKMMISLNRPHEPGRLVRVEKAFGQGGTFIGRHFVFGHNQQVALGNNDKKVVEITELTKVQRPSEITL